MIITATELKTNLGKYLELAAIQDIFITKKGKNIARLTSPSIDKLSVLDSLVGIIP
ncbi:MAG TPA: type II toxin-antitoxin system prevent-host-death family antitoxin, partial [Lachnospiraceae bacterium]|nr:type II toxin-antitoxin system prevent-host-death family antitoxin [Lachnospiraceae bacterium]